MHLLNSIYTSKKHGKKGVALLIDPDKTDLLDRRIQVGIRSEVDYIFVGSSLLLDSTMDDVIKSIKAQCDIPVILFPGNTYQLSSQADAILFLSLVSGRNPDLLIGKQVEAAPRIHNANLEVLSTAYILVDGGNTTSVSYMSQTVPIPSDKNDIAIATALASKYLGFNFLYLDAGSGAKYSVPPTMIRNIKSMVDLPIIVGGGIRNPEQAYNLVNSGADILVLGNGVEKNPELLVDISHAVKSEKWIA